MKNINITCTNINCPERQGGKCNAEKEYTHEEKIEIITKAQKHLTENSKNLDPDMAQILSDHFWELLWK